MSVELLLDCPVFLRLHRSQYVWPCLSRNVASSGGFMIGTAVIYAPSGPNTTVRPESLNPETLSNGREMSATWNCTHTSWRSAKM